MTEMQKTQKHKKWKKRKKNITQITSFLQNWKKNRMENICFFVITFEPIKIETRAAPQNDCLNLSFVENIHVVGKKMARKGQKTAIYQ